MNVEIGPRTLQDLIDGVARRALRFTPKVDSLDNAKEAADSLAIANSKFIREQMAEQNARAPEGQRLTPAELHRRVNDVPVNSKFFRRLAGLRNGDLTS